MKKLQRVRARQDIFALLAIVVAFAITGCATTTAISQQPFQEFAESLQKVRSGADNSLGAVYDQTRARYIENAALGGPGLDAVLLTTAPNDPFRWASSGGSVPLFLTEARFRDGVYRLNSSLVDYATALVQLSSPDLLNPETFNALATDLNNNLNKALPALGVQPPSQGVAIFSAAATAGFRLYLQNKQRSALADAISKNQSAIQDTAKLGRSAMELTVREVANEYAERSTALAREIQGAPEASKRAKAKDLIDLDDAFIKDLAVLRALHQSYIDLPAAHADLAAAAGDSKVGIGAIRRLYEQGRELERLYEQLIKQNKSK